MTHRQRKVERLIQQELSGLLEREVKDPRLNSLVSVTEVRTSPDLKHAKVFVSVLGNEDEVLEGLNCASGFLRRELGKRVTLKHIPELSFERDNSIERGIRLLQLIKQVSSEDGEQS